MSCAERPLADCFVVPSSPVTWSCIVHFPAFAACVSSSDGCASASALDTIGKTRDVVRRVGGPGRGVGVCVDSWHFFRGPDSWAELEALPADELAYVQFNDALPLVSDDLMHETLHRRTAPGEGEFDLDRFCEVVRAKGYDGPVAVEVMSEPLRARGVEEYARAVLDGARRYWP